MIHLKMIGYTALLIVGVHFTLGKVMPTYFGV